MNKTPVGLAMGTIGHRMCWVAATNVDLEPIKTTPNHSKWLTKSSEQENNLARNNISFVVEGKLQDKMLRTSRWSDQRF